MSKHRTTADDVARMAGVSRSAVSRAFTPGASVSEGTRQRIRQAATQLGYAPNAIARMLIKRQNNLVGVVMSDPTNTFLSHLLTRLLDRLQGAGYFPLLFRVSQREDFDTVLPTVLQYQVGAIFVTGSTPSPQVAAHCLNAGTPVCVLNRWVIGDYPGQVISCDHELGGRIAADALVHAGHRRIALVTSVGERSPHQARVRGFTQRLEELGRSLGGFEAGAPTHASGYTSALRLLSSGTPPDALCTGDLLAFGALDAARKLHVPVPAGCGVLGFDDVEMAAWPGYDLSTIHQPVHALVESALRYMGHSPGTTPPSRLLVPPHFVARGSTLHSPAA